MTERNKSENTKITYIISSHLFSLGFTNVYFSCALLLTELKCNSGGELANVFLSLVELNIHQLSSGL